MALVLNGDIFDSLAEDVDGYVAVEQAVPMLERIFDDPQFAPVWNALAEFVKAPGRTLVLVIGNHDIELAFPAVQRAIEMRLAGDDPAARGRIEFSTFGAGYACLVGGSRVFCTHGNEVDAWNYVRYEDLSRAARRLTAGRALDSSEWQPNAGTKLVKDVMNRVKRRYAWIDLLKPEVQAALGVLLVLDPSQLAAIERVLPVVAETVRGRYDYDKRLSSAFAGDTSSTASTAGGTDRLLGPELRAGMRGNQRGATRGDHDILLDLERNWESGSPLQGRDGTLGAGELVWNRLTGWLKRTDEAEALRRALKDWLARGPDIRDRRAGRHLQAGHEQRGLRRRFHRHRPHASRARDRHGRRATLLQLRHVDQADAVHRRDPRQRRELQAGL